jgi:L-ribulose-5-phosphate 3-epimerase
MNSPTRRTFLQAAAAGAIGASMTFAQATKQSQPKLKKALKYASIVPGNTPLEKFELIKPFGFVGVEIDSPNNLDRDAILKAANDTGMKVHGIIDSVHWKQRFSDPDENVRKQAGEALATALRDGKFLGATTCLVVPGKVSKDDSESFEKVWSRSHDEIRKAIPLAQETGVKIAIEVVWNDFITKPEQFVKYIDEFNSEWVGGYMDMSNMIKFGVPSADWVRALGKRMLKFDFKGYNNETHKWVKIGDGSEDWPEVLKALDEVGYHDWATAEVPIPTREELKDVSDRMDKALGL